MITLQDILAALGTVINGIPSMIFAMSFGFQALPTALGYLVGIGGMAAYGTVAPISIQGETIALTGTMGKNNKERFSIVLFSGILMLVLGALGLLQVIINFAGDSIINGMKAGVGIILAKLAIDMVKENKLVGFVSVATALCVYFPTQDLTYTLIASVVVSSVVFFIKNKKPLDIAVEKYKFQLHKPVVNQNVIRSALALACLSIGTNIAFGGITSGMAGVEPNIDGLTVYSGLADVVTGLLGGAPVESVISPTGAAPNPFISGILMMAIMAIILATGLLPKIARFVPVQSLAGFLFVLGAFVNLPQNAAATFSGASGAEALAGGVTIGVTALVDPFIGLIAGIVVRIAAQFFGFGI